MVRGRRVIMASDRILRRYFMLISHYWGLRGVRLCVGVCLHVEIGVDIAIPESLSHLRQKDDNFLILPLVGYQYILPGSLTDRGVELGTVTHPHNPGQQRHGPSFNPFLAVRQVPHTQLLQSLVLTPGSDR